MQTESITKQSIMGKQSISEDLVALIKQQIIDGELNPGDRIVETKVAKELGISQTPVREAIRQLSGEGIITIVPNKGPIVRTMDSTDVFEIYSLRSFLEGLAIRLAAQYATDDDISGLVSIYEDMKLKLSDDTVRSLLKESLTIHQTIIRLSRHARLIKMYDSISFQITLVNRILGVTSTKQKEVAEHWELIDAMMKRDPEHAEKVMRNHIYKSFSDCSLLMDDQIRQFDKIIWV
ncbi:GntR family transcriptional regulator [Paenibacillus sp. MBLB4367]|uniref:GntR family transcriptional regulator n=1 Tax=Paenibacillus sp. MBLB4367 TaxID=3384767 RepID=UPI00390844D6